MIIDFSIPFINKISAASMLHAIESAQASSDMRVERVRVALLHYRQHPTLRLRLVAEAACAALSYTQRVELVHVSHRALGIRQPQHDIA